MEVGDWKKRIRCLGEAVGEFPALAAGAWRPPRPDMEATWEVRGPRAGACLSNLRPGRTEGLAHHEAGRKAGPAESGSVVVVKAECSSQPVRQQQSAAQLRLVVPGCGLSYRRGSSSLDGADGPVLVQVVHESIPGLEQDLPSFGTLAQLGQQEVRPLGAKGAHPPFLGFPLSRRQKQHVAAWCVGLGPARGGRLLVFSLFLHSVSWVAGH